ncbi:MAG: S9 family peptidase [Deltaproteobacteria bacterium]|nr:S9 family peptidase [Deltaproteobacteria bacterium]
MFRSTRDGIPEVYVSDVNSPRSPARRVTCAGERVAWAAFARDGASILFLRDEGGNQRFRLFRTSLDGSAVELLTPDDTTIYRHIPILPRTNPARIVYSARLAGSPSTRVIVHAIGDDGQRVIYEDPFAGTCVDTTEDGSRALFLRNASLVDSMVLEIDLETGAARPVFPRTGEATIACVAYSADGTAMFVACETHLDGPCLLALDASTGEIKATHRQEVPAGSFISRLVVSPDGHSVAIRVDAGSHSDLHILDAKTLTSRIQVATLLGGIELYPFSDDGRYFAISQSVPDHPVELFLVDASTGAVRPLRMEPRPGLETDTMAVSIHRIPAFDGLEIPVNLYVPKQSPSSAASPLATIVLIHGGPAASAQVRWNPAARFFTSLGYVVIEPNIRGSIGFGRAYAMADDREKRWNAFRDVESIHAWAAHHSFCDPRRMILMGGSYGGYVTLMSLGLQPALWRAGISLFAMADLRKYVRLLGPGARKALAEEFGDPEADAELLAELSPIRRLEKIVAPLFVYAGENDPQVGRRDSDSIVRVLKDRGVPVEYMVGANEGHSMERRETQVMFFMRAARFLSEHLQ